MSSSTRNQVDLTVQPVRPIRFWQHWRAVANTFRAYQPGTDAFVDQIRSAGFVKRFVFQYLFAPLYFAAEQGWTILASTVRWLRSCICAEAHGRVYVSCTLMTSVSE